MNEFWQGRPTLVTGGTGLIGSWLVKDLLAAGARVTVLVKEADPQSELLRSGDIHRVAVVNGELENFWTLEHAINLHEIDTVFHLGAQTIVGVANRFPLQTFESNIRGTYNLLEVCRIHRSLVKRIVVASSDKAYGHHEMLPYTEDSALMGRHPYDVSKTCTDLLAQSYAQTYALPVAITRCGNVYGGGDLNWSRLIPGAIRSLWQGESPIVRSDGTFLRDYIFVKDVSRAYMTVAEKMEDLELQGQAFNFSPERPLTVLAVLSALQRLMGQEDLRPTILSHATNEIHRQYLSAEKAQRILGWAPGYDLQAGLKETIDWYAAYLHVAYGPPRQRAAAVAT